ncbi:MAG: LuxR C-terminal-related transcriptional regulator [Chloroflexota bacterium]|nr:LuxR C-terminal-related transcriptional regulator [Chloroflexota bacterium]
MLVPDARRTVGRREELDEIDDLVDRLRVGAPAVLVLRGEAGIGKSHLCRVAVSRAAAAGIRTAVATADELEQDRPGRLLFAAEASLSEDHLDAPVPSEAHPVDGDPGYRTAARFVTGIEQATVAGPVLLVAEDVHWADDLSLRGLAMLVRGIDQVPCGVIATMRNHPRPSRVADLEAAIEALRGRVHGRVAELAGLAPAAIEELASQWLRATPGPTLRSMLTRAAGNPFMVEELIRAADRDKSILVADGVAEVAADAVPSTLYDALIRLLRTLSPPTVDALRHASLLGRHFTATELAAVTSRLVIDVVRVLDEAADAGMVITGDEHYVFRHDLVRDAVYRSISPAARWDLHRAAGAALAAADAPALRVAQQFAAGARPGDLEAVEWLCRAANDALAVDTASAADLLERALSLAPRDWAGRFDLEADLVELLAWAGRVDDAARRGQALVDRALSAEERFRAHQALGSVRTSFGDLRGAAEQFRAAADTASADDAASDQLRCAAAGMSVIAGAESPGDARAVATPHLTSERADVVCWARNTLAVAAVSEGAYDEAIEHARVAVSILDDQYVRPLGFLIPHGWEAAGLQCLDRYDESREAAERTRRRAERRGDAGLLVQVMACTCGITWTQGDWDGTVAEIDAAFALMEDTGVVVHTILFHSLAALIAVERGQPDEAATHLQAAEAFVASGTLHLFGIDILAAVQARQLKARQETEAACDLLTAVWEATAPLRGLIQWRLIGPQLVGLCVATGRVAQTATLVDELRALSGRSTAPSAAATAMRAEGLATRDAGLLVRAADALLATPRRIEAADAAEDAVHALFAAGRPSKDVERLLGAAEEAYVRAHAIAGLERVQALRREAGLTTRVGGAPAARFGWHSLTPKEVEIVRLVSRGMSNTDIAAELFISRRTVEAHLSHVFQKLEISNRTELAREAIDRDVA